MVSGQVLPSVSQGKLPPRLGLEFGPRVGLVLGLEAMRQLPLRKIVPWLGLGVGLGLVLGLGDNFPKIHGKTLAPV